MNTLLPLSHLHSTEVLFDLLGDFQAAVAGCDDADLAEIANEAAQEIADALRDGDADPLYDDSDDDGYNDMHDLDCDDLAAADEVM